MNCTAIRNSLSVADANHFSDRILLTGTSTFDQPSSRRLHGRTLLFLRCTRTTLFPRSLLIPHYKVHFSFGNYFPKTHPLRPQTQPAAAPPATSPPCTSVEFLSGTSRRRQRPPPPPSLQHLRSRSWKSPGEGRGGAGHSAAAFELPSAAVVPAAVRGGVQVLGANGSRRRSVADVRLTGGAVGRILSKPLSLGARPHNEVEESAAATRSRVMEVLWFCSCSRRRLIHSTSY